MNAHFIYEDAPYRAAHASTLVEVCDAVLGAWFAGPREGAPETSIWMGRFAEGRWAGHRNLLTGAAAEPEACWNPVFHRSDDTLLLFYRTGRHPQVWHSKVMVSKDAGETWGAAKPLPAPYLGPIKNKALEIEPGILLCPSSTEHDGWRAHVERFSVADLQCLDWAPMADRVGFNAIQPTLLHWPDGRLQALCRTMARVIAESWSDDKGKTWSTLEQSELENPNSGFDALVLEDGRAVLVTNPSAQARSPLQILISDDGTHWRSGPVLEHGVGEFSYPAVIQAADGSIHVSYTHDRIDIRHVVLDPDELE